MEAVAAPARRVPSRPLRLAETAVSRRTKPKDPFREKKRERINAELAAVVESRRRAMVNLLRPREAEHSRIEPVTNVLRPARFGGAGESIVGEVADAAAEYACMNRSDRRRKLRERGNGRLAPGVATMAVKIKTRS